MIEGQAENPPVHVRYIELVFGGRVAVKGEPEQAHVGVRHGCDGGRRDELAVVVVSKYALAVRIEMPTCRWVGKEVASAGRDVYAALVYGNAERVPWRRHASENGRVANRRMVKGLVGEGGPDALAEPDRCKDRHRSDFCPPTSVHLHRLSS